jgi:hypothetical protein
MSCEGCDNCTEVKCLAQCVTDIEIGTIADPNEPLNVYLHDGATDRLIQGSATSDGAGLVTWTVNTGIKFMPHRSYTLWLNKVSEDAKIFEKEEITIDSTQVECVTVTFLSVHDPQDQVTYTKQTLQLKTT